VKHNRSVSYVPEEAKVCEIVVEILAFIRVPRNLKGCNDGQGFRTIIRVRERRGRGIWEVKDIQVVLIFNYQLDSFFGPDVHCCIGDHPSIAAGR
jgi:hypothetical protein